MKIGTGYFYNQDCMEGMKEFPDKFFELAIVDPPYGIGMDKPIIMPEIKNKFGKLRTNANYKKSNWDNKIPNEDYFIELFRISKNQIICGGNYFTDFLEPTNAWIFWDKKLNENNGKTFSDGELLWTSLSFSLTKYTYGWVGFDYINNPQREIKIHPTQKPIALYKWLLTKYAKPGDKILDTHVGSASSIIAFIDLELEFIGYEIDKDYYDSAMKRTENYLLQEKLF